MTPRLAVPYCLLSVICAQDPPSFPMEGLSQLLWGGRTPVGRGCASEGPALPAFRRPGAQLVYPLCVWKPPYCSGSPTPRIQSK